MALSLCWIACLQTLDKVKDFLLILFVYHAQTEQGLPLLFVQLAQAVDKVEDAILILFVHNPQTKQYHTLYITKLGNTVIDLALQIAGGLLVIGIVSHACIMQRICGVALFMPSR